mmetsp:Transcript_10886/g.16051  ORF Transcript_10886/g.16051 Transcript_10886/m.16051 type:complete len:371 (+) Transcript_10886:115-1227(+)
MLRLLLILQFVFQSNSWALSKSRLPRFSLGVSSIESADIDVLSGVSDFELWFNKLEHASCQSSISHSAFGRLRGLTCGGGIDDGNNSVMTIPKSVILSSNYASEEWDTELALKLWEQCQKGSQSFLSGYCSLLSRGEKINPDSVPPSSAPNALRHWTKEQLDKLAQSAKGEKLIILKEKQEEKWRQKYNSISSENTVSWEQFEWCMEVVHSRAFRGTYGLSSMRTIVSAAAPLIAALLGWFYIQGNADYSDSVLLGLGALSASPLLIDTVSPDQGEVVLLPLIDSANHLEEADSKIEFDPLKGVFSLSVGPKCLVESTKGEGQFQLFISYGPKSNSELLLNYGFLPGVSSGNADDEQRDLMTTAFLNRFS